MPDNNSLLRQLASRASKLHEQTNISQAQMAEAIGMASGNYSAFLAGRKGIGAQATCLLLKYTNMPRAQAIAKFNKPVRSSRIMELQECGKTLRFDNSGWVPREGGTDDPNGTTDIASTSDAITARMADLVSVFKRLD